MRRSFILFMIIYVATLLLLVHSVWTLLTLLVCTGIEDAILPEELLDNSRPQLIPRILHQTYKNTSIPGIWQEAQRSCLALHSDWDYSFWTDDSSKTFIAQEYPWFLETFHGYDYDIQRADAIRYFVLKHYGGIYVDLDDGCQRSLEPLLRYPALVRKTKPTGVSNDVMGAVPGHPFFSKVVEELQNYDTSWFSPYITVMSSTGPLFLSILWRHWKMESMNTGDQADGIRVRILFHEEYMGLPSSFFVHYPGSSWHRYNVGLMFWLLHNWRLVTIVCIIGGMTISICAVVATQSFAHTVRSRLQQAQRPSI